MSDSLTEQLADASNILVLEDGASSADERIHEMLLSGLTERETDVLVVTFSRPGPWLDAWGDQLVSAGSNLGLVRLSETDRREGRRNGAHVRSVNPNDLTGLGMAIRDFFDGAASSPNDAVVCFDSLTELSEYNSVRTLFRFLRVITQQVSTEDATAHFHVDPVAHDSQSLARLKPPFDAHVKCEDADEVSVSRPY
ncbi:DUF7504 family protein [Halobacterium litoreum]